MFKYIALSLLVAVSLAAYVPPSKAGCAQDSLKLARSMPVIEEDEFKSAFSEFVVKHGKTYSSDEFEQKYDVFRANYRMIKAHEHRRQFDASVTYSLAVNEFADMTNAEFRATLNGFKGKEQGKRLAARGTTNVRTFDDVDQGQLPATVDWRTKGAVTAVKNQGHCGSCWSFSATGSMEGQHFLSHQGNLTSLSEQNLMDCSTKEGDMGCNGGLMDDAFKYVISNKGVDTEASYPYQGVQGTCHYTKENRGAWIDSYKDITSGSETDLKTASATVGPISVAIDAGEPSFQFYSGGVYYSYLCGNKPNDLDHGVLVVGYGTEGEDDYWLVKNSWGASWGLSGYIKMIRNWKNNCGIATSASYPIISSK